MPIIKDYKAYTDNYGLVQPYPSPRISGNGLRYTAEYVVALAKHNKLSSSEKNRLKAVYKSCQPKDKPGLLMRTPKNEFGQEGPDDYVGAGLASKYLDGEPAKAILAYGRTRRKYGIIPYYYNNTSNKKWDWSAFIGRQQQVICHLQFGAGENPPLWRKLWWSFVVLHSTRGDKKHHDGWALSWSLCKTAEGKSWLCDQVIKYFRKKFKAKYPGGMGELVGSYFRNKNHPAVRYLDKDY